MSEWNVIENAVEFYHIVFLKMPALPNASQQVNIFWCHHHHFHPSLSLFHSLVQPNTKKHFIMLFGIYFNFKSNTYWYWYVIAFLYAKTLYIGILPPFVGCRQYRNKIQKFSVGYVSKNTENCLSRSWKWHYMNIKVMMMLENRIKGG